MWPAVRCFSTGRTSGLTNTIGECARRHELVQFRLQQPTEFVHFPRRKPNRKPCSSLCSTAGLNPLLQRRIERDDVQPVVLIAVARRDGPRQPPAHVLRQHDRVLGAAAHNRRGLPGSGPTGGSAPPRAKHLQDLLHLAQLHHAGDQLVDHGRRGLRAVGRSGASRRRESAVRRHVAGRFRSGAWRSRCPARPRFRRSFPGRRPRRRS